MNKLLSTFTDTILPLIILLALIIIAIVIYKLLQKKFNKPINSSLQKNSKPQVKLKSPYCTEYEMAFLDALHKALPRDFISFPNVGVSKLIEPKGNLLDYNAIVDKYVDICVFLRKDMKPVLVIDLYQESPVSQQLKKFDDNVSAVLKEVKIPVLHKLIKNNYKSDDLKIELLKAMNNETVAYLKDKTIESNNK